MGNSECSTAQANCDRNVQEGRNNDLPIRPQQPSSYVVAEADVLGVDDRRGPAAGGFQTPPDMYGAPSPAFASNPPLSSSPHVHGNLGHDQAALLSPGEAKSGKRLQDWLHDLHPSASRDQPEPSRGGLDGDLGIWKTLPDHQPGLDLAPSSQVDAAAGTGLHGPGRSAAKEPYIHLEPAIVAPVAITVGGPDGHATQRCFFDLDVGEAPQQDHAAMIAREQRRFTFRSGAVYDGEWLGGMRDGVGHQRWADGTEYAGEWQRGRAGGFGMIRHRDEDEYTGQWINGRAHGNGVYRFQGGCAVYEGEFKCDMRDGLGVEVWVDGSWYAGEFRKGMKHGSGQHTWPDGASFAGTWMNNELQGTGRYHMQDGASYEGQWMQSTIHGIGEYKWPDGQRYAGKYDMDQKHGFGVLRLASGQRREGFWSHGTPAGKKIRKKRPSE